MTATPEGRGDSRLLRSLDLDDAIGLSSATCAGNPRILLVATLRWPLAARLAIAFGELGCPVEAWCPVGHPLEKTRAVERIHRSGALTPLRSMQAAILAAAPDFIVPCDDDAAIHLHQLHEQSPDDGPSALVRRLIERSLGTPASCSLVTARGSLMQLAVAEDVRVPEFASIRSLADLEAWGMRCGFPSVLKVDRSWGGLGVSVVDDIGQARAAFRGALHPSLTRALSQLIMRRDSSQLRCRADGVQRAVTIQAYIAGQPANSAVVCAQGEILAGISVVALRTQSPTGPATVVHVIDNDEMSRAARRLVRALGLSGFCGLDFVIEASSGAAYLIEVNPRATPISHLSLGAGQDLPAALHARLSGRPAPAGPSTIPNDIIAMFPGEWRRNPKSPYLRNAFHDVPWAETELVHDCTALPWEARGIAARIRTFLRV